MSRLTTMMTQELQALHNLLSFTGEGEGEGEEAQGSVGFLQNHVVGRENPPPVQGVT